jgi:hypothetical protein
MPSGYEKSDDYGGPKPSGPMLLLQLLLAVSFLAVLMFFSQT